MIRLIGSIARWSVTVAIVLLLLVAITFVIDFQTRRSLTQGTWVEKDELGEGDPTNLVVVFPGAFSGAKFQFQPLAAELDDVSATVLYIEQSGSMYSYQNVDAAAIRAVSAYLDIHDVRKISFVGTSMGAGRAWQLATTLHKSGQLKTVETVFVAVDGVGLAKDLAGPGPFGAKIVSRFPFGWLWNYVPVAKAVIQPSSTPPALKWQQHARDGLRRSRATTTASWAGQLAAMRDTKVTADSLAWVDEVIYIESTRDLKIVSGHKSITTWRAASAPGGFVVREVDANHTDYEALPLVYAAIIENAIM